jgi:hypothetical protein
MRVIGRWGLQREPFMDPEDLSVRYPKPKSNAVLTIALTLCFGGLFLLLALIAAFLIMVLAGERIIVSNFTYLFAVFAYLGLIVGGLVAAGLTLTLPRWKSPWPVSVGAPAPRPVGRLLGTASARASIPRSASSAWLRLD